MVALVVASVDLVELTQCEPSAGDLHAVSLALRPQPRRHRQLAESFKDAGAWVIVKPISVCMTLFNFGEPTHDLVLRHIQQLIMAEH